MATVLQPFNPIAGVPEAIAAIMGRRRQRQQQQSQAGELAQLAQMIQSGQQIDPSRFQNPQIAQLALGQIIRQQQPQAPIFAKPGDVPVGPTGQPSGPAIPEAPKPRAGALQVAKAGDQTGLPIGTVFQLDPQGNAKIISEVGGNELSKSDKVNLAVNESKAFRTDERIKNLQIVERSERGMKAALKLSTGPDVKSRIASDQALGVLFQKMLDPTSVVRESEFARTPEGASLMNRLEAVFPQLKKGGLKITNEDRQALVTMAQKLLDGAKATANKAFSEFGTRADEIGLNKKIIFGGAKPFNIGNLQGLVSPVPRDNLPSILTPPGTQPTPPTVLTPPRSQSNAVSVLPLGGQPPASVGQQRQQAIQQREQIQALTTQLRTGEILVRDKASGQIGALPAGEFNPNQFERVQ